MSDTSAGVYYFANWPDYQFHAWLAGFFDGEGCVYMRPGRVGIEVSIVNTDQDAIRSIHKRLGFGQVATLREAGPRHKKQLYWRARKLDEVRRFILLVRPYLTTKATRADRAIVRVAESTMKQQAQQNRYDDVRSLRRRGKSQPQIAEALGMTRSNVSRILNRQEPGRSLL